jgi:MFS family permease
MYLETTQTDAVQSPTSSRSSLPAVDDEESFEARIERLGRERPPTFKTEWAELSFVFSIIMSQIITEFFVSGFVVILPRVVDALDIPSSSQVWPATAFSLVIASTLLVFGRLGDMFGGYIVYVGGLAWLLVWSIICGFSVNPLMLDICRAMQGLGAAAYLPTGVMLMGTAFRPGPRKNFVFAIYGLFAVIGFFIGILVAGVVGQYLHWGWYFWFGSIITGITLVSSIFSIDNDRQQRLANHIKMDWWGSTTIVCGMVLFVFSITESAHAKDGWRTPYIPTLFSISILLLAAAVYVEGWVAEVPLLPPDLFENPAMAPLVTAMMFLYGTWGIYILYGTHYFMDIMGVTPIQVVAWYTPTAVGGFVLNILEAFILHLVPGRFLLITSAVAAVGSQLLLALVPLGGNYWAYIFPAMILATAGIDLSYTLMSVFITTTLPSARQGLGGGLINSVLQLGIAVCLGFTDIIQSYTVEDVGLRQSYKFTFWFGVAAAAMGLILVTLFGKVPKAKSDLTADEKAELAREATREVTREATRQSMSERR